MRILQRIKYYFKYIFQVITEPINHLTQEEVENEIDYFKNISNLNEETEDMIIWYERLKKQKK